MKSNIIKGRKGVEMSKKELIIVVVIAVVVVGVILIIGAITGGKGNSNNAANTAANEEYVQVLSDGTKLNNSSKLQGTKQVEGLDITNLQLTSKGSQTVLLGTIKNNTSGVLGGFPATVTILDKNGNTIQTLGAYINQIQPGQEQQLNVSSTLDYANAYDIEIAKK